MIVGGTEVNSFSWIRSNYLKQNLAIFCKKIYWGIAKFHEKLKQGFLDWEKKSVEKGTVLRSLTILIKVSDIYFLNLLKDWIRQRGFTQAVV